MGLFISKLGLFLSKLILWKREDGKIRESELIPNDLDAGSYTNNKVVGSAQNHDADGKRYDTGHILENSESMTDEEKDNSSVDRRSSTSSEPDDEKDKELTCTSQPVTDKNPLSTSKPVTDKKLTCTPQPVTDKELPCTSRPMTDKELTCTSQPVTDKDPPSTPEPVTIKKLPCLPEPVIDKETTDMSESSHLSGRVADLEQSVLSSTLIKERDLTDGTQVSSSTPIKERDQMDETQPLETKDAGNVTDESGLGTPDCKGNITETSPFEDQRKIEEFQLHRRNTSLYYVKDNEDILKKWQKLENGQEYQMQQLEFLQNQLADIISSKQLQHDLQQEEQHRLLQKQLEDKDTLIKQLEKEFQETQGRLADQHTLFQQQLETKENTVKELEQTVRQLEQTVQKSQDNLAHKDTLLQQQLAEKNSAIETLQQKQEEDRLLCQQLEEMKSAVCRLERNCHDAQEAVSKLQSEKEQTEQYLKWIEDKFSLLEHEKQTGEQKKNGPQGTFTELFQETEASEQEKTQTVLDDITSVTLEVSQLRETNKQIREQLNVLETQWKAAQDFATALGQENTVHQIQAAQAIAESQELKLQLDNQKMQNRDLQDQVQQMQRKGLSLRENIERDQLTIAGLQAELQKTQDLVRSRDETIAAERAKISRGEAALEQSVSHCKELEAVLQARNEELYRCQREVEVQRSQQNQMSR